MPNWQPNWSNVAWDWGAASGAVSALRRAADLLDQTAGERSYKSRAATAEWRGVYRDEFDEHFRRTLANASALADEYRAAANRIATASQRALEEQRRRERERKRWYREKEAEERARQQNQL